MAYLALSVENACTAAGSCAWSVAAMAARTGAVEAASFPMAATQAAVGLTRRSVGAAAVLPFGVDRLDVGAGLVGRGQLVGRRLGAQALQER